MTVRHDRPGAAEAQDSDWMHTLAVGDQAAVRALPSTLHLGERQAIVLAGELRASILIDEQRGRAVARERGLIVLGSLWILAEAKRLGIIEQAKPLLDAMLAAAYWIDEDLVPPFLQEVGENISL
jgi:predicted nucleic acid-binding protein